MYFFRFALKLALIYFREVTNLFNYMNRKEDITVGRNRKINKTKHIQLRFQIEIQFSFLFHFIFSVNSVLIFLGSYIIHHEEGMKVMTIQMYACMHMQVCGYTNAWKINKWQISTWKRNSLQWSDQHNLYFWNLLMAQSHFDGKGLCSSVVGCLIFGLLGPAWQSGYPLVTTFIS